MRTRGQLPVYVARCLSPAPACTHYPTAASQRPAGAGTFGNKKLSHSNSSISCHPTATEDGAGGQRSKTFQSSGRALCSAGTRSAENTTCSTFLVQRRLNRASFSSPEIINGETPKSCSFSAHFPCCHPAPRARAWSHCQSRREQGTFPMVIPINEPTAIHVQRLRSFH